MSAKANEGNIMAEKFDDGGEVTSAMPTKEEILMREDELLAGLFAAEAEKGDNEVTKQTLYINRRGKTYFMFDIRPLSEQELVACRKRATKYHDNPAGKKYPRVEGETDVVLLRSLKIYMATTEEYKKKLWDNPAVLTKFNLIQGCDVVEKVFIAGEKDAIIDKIDELSGYDSSDLEEYAKN